MVISPTLHWDLILRIAVGAILGGIIGFERDIHGRQAGLRTHLIVAMASATFMVVSSHFYLFQEYGSSHEGIEVDVSRIAASVVSGIGFLAGGAILKTGLTIQGLTTAAGLWLVAAIGLCAGAGMYVEGASVTVLGLIALTGLRFFEDKDDETVRRSVTVTMGYVPDGSSKVLAILSDVKVRVPDFDYERKMDSQTLTMKFEARIPLNLGVDGLIQLLEKQEGIQHVHIQS